MKTFYIILQIAGAGRFSIIVEAWNVEQAREIAKRDNPGAVIVEIEEEK